MKCRLIILTILSILYCKVYGQAKLCIVGTIHNPTAKINSDSIFEVIKKFSPTIILYEADTILDIRNDLKGIDGGNTNEFIAINKYLKIKSSTKILPFDWTEKQKFREQNNYWTKIDSMNKAINTHFDRGNPTKLSLVTIESLMDFSELNNLLLKENLFMLNQPFVRRLTELKTKWEHQKLIEMANADDTLRNFIQNIKLGQTYWELRNKNMAINILRILKESPKSRILVLTGNNHKYFLYNEIAHQQKQFGFVLTEFWENK